MSDMLDCLIVGGGPAGLTAALYLSRYHLAIRVVDDGASRAGWIPCSRNVAGFPDGIAGTALLERMRDHARRFGTRITQARVSRIEAGADGFTAEWGSGPARARTVLLATGTVNRRPPMDEDAHAEALARGLVRYCPVCDGYEVTDKRIAVLGDDAHGVAEALFLRGFTRDVTLIAPHARQDRLSADDRARLADAGIATGDGPVAAVRVAGNAIRLELPGGARDFDSLYPALGSDPRAGLAEMLGLARAEDGTIRTDDHQRASLAGVYAAGDVVKGLDQISHAMGEGGVAATTIRNDLARIRPILR